MNKREIYTDIIEAIDELRETQKETSPRISIDGQILDRKTDPKSEIVGEEYFNENPVRITIDGRLSWRSLGETFQIEGEFPRRDRETDSPTTERKPQLEGKSILDYCAWYKSYNYLPRTLWGIHIREDCWDSLANRLYYDCPSTIATTQDAYRAAFFYFFCHEFFHYLNNNAVNVLGIVTRDPFLYNDYMLRVYWPNYRSPGAIEEALANRYLYGRNKLCHIPKKYLYDDLKRDPPGYRDFVKYLGKKFFIGRRELMSQALSLNPAIPPGTKPIEQVLEVLRTTSYSKGHNVPIWLHPAKIKGPVRITTPYS